MKLDDIDLELKNLEKQYDEKIKLFADEVSDYSLRTDYICKKLNIIIILSTIIMVLFTIYISYISYRSININILYSIACISYIFILYECYMKKIDAKYKYTNFTMDNLKDISEIYNKLILLRIQKNNIKSEENKGDIK